MNLSIKDLLHPRILQHCEKLFQDSHFKHAAHEAMIQVELALKEKSGETNKYGVNLVSTLFGKDKGIKLRVPFGDDLQKHAHTWFKGAFSYYRNYTAHDGSKIQERSCARILVTASELLELIGASSKNFADIGGVEGLVKQGLFKDRNRVKELLKIMDGYCLPDHICDGFYEMLFENGFGNDHVAALIEVGLVEYKSEPYNHLKGIKIDTEDLPDEVGWFELTGIGKKIKNNI